MGNIFIFKAADDDGNRVYVSNVPKKLVAQTLALMRAFDQAGDVHELNRSRHASFRLDDRRQPFQALIRHGRYADIGFDGSKGIVGDGSAGLGQGIE